MKTINKFENAANWLQCPDTGKLILRLLLGGMMISHGIAKLSGLEGIMGMLAGVGLPGFIAYGIYVGEIVAPVMIILGVRARIGALFLAINMVFAILLAHSKDIFAIGKGGAVSLEVPYFYLFGAMALMFLGAGKIALLTKSKWD